MSLSGGEERASDGSTAVAAKVDSTNVTSPPTPMGYIQDFDQELDAMFARGEDKDVIIRFVKKVVIESYKNGITAAHMVDAGKDASRKATRFAGRK